MILSIPWLLLWNIHQLTPHFDIYVFSIFQGGKKKKNLPQWSFKPILPYTHKHISNYILTVHPLYIVTLELALVEQGKDWKNKKEKTAREFLKIRSKKYSRKHIPMKYLWISTEVYVSRSYAFIWWKGS